MPSIESEIYEIKILISNIENTLKVVTAALERIKNKGF